MLKFETKLDKIFIHTLSTISVISCFLKVIRATLQKLAVPQLACEAAVFRYSSSTN